MNRTASLFRHLARAALQVWPGLTLAAALALAGSAMAAPPLWRIPGAGAQITLFGSVHLLPRDTDWRTPALDAAIARADEVWFEIPFDAASQAAAGRIALQRGLLPEGTHLSQLLNPAQRTALAHLETVEGQSPSSIERMQPWLADTVLSVTYFERRGADAAGGVEEQISRTLPPATVRGAFETAAQQIGFFADLPLKDQVESLNETLQEIETDPAAFDRLAAAWVQGDVRAIDREAVAKLKTDAPGVYQRLVVDRNRRWTARIAQLLAGNKRIFIVVGVGHLVGPDSVPAMLRARGIKVEGP